VVESDSWAKYGGGAPYTGLWHWADLTGGACAVLHGSGSSRRTEEGQTGEGREDDRAAPLEHLGAQASLLQRRPVHYHLVAAPVPLVLADLVAERAGDASRAGVHVDDVLFEVEFVGEEAVTDRTDARLSGAPLSTAPLLGTAC